MAKLGSPPAPDLLITTALGQFGAEAKRIKSVKLLKVRAKEANKQLRFLPSGGLLLTDLSLFFSTASEYNSVSDATRDLEQKLYHFMYIRLPLMRSATTPKSCFAWTAYAQAPCFLHTGPPMQVFQWKTFNLCHERDWRWLHIVQFTSALSRFSGDVKTHLEW
jgi:hypothetical protein